ncbi:hypothetical protein AVEN_24142-1 [Araneus ventricosus]|uniref:Uncharacterized protein n=1 Tax=Araneus ventricosus TaxID=182803 RepID=A0A4Y2M787_ARAVE|nr:hypothetical protein AVEN_24142-1 [Araneus ventricosus]
MPEEETDEMGSDKMDGDFEILNNDEIASSVNTAEEEIADDEGSLLSKKPTTSHSEAETMLSKCVGWFEVQEEANAIQILLKYKI